LRSRPGDLPATETAFASEVIPGFEFDLARIRELCR
jgi:hypothetical protein